MGTLEKREREKIRIGRYQRAIVTAVGVAGALAAVAVAPAAFQALRLTGLDKALRRRRYQTITRARLRLIDAGLLKNEGAARDWRLILTAEGERLFAKLSIGNHMIHKPKRWDKKWRVVIFDIRERRRAARDELRDALQRIGFLRLQHSVWVFPYDCEDLIALLKAKFELGKEVLYLIVDEIENDRHIKKYFELEQNE